jgi:hypothetical protein
MSASLGRSRRTVMLTRSQQIGLLIILCVFVVYVFARVR